MARDKLSNTILEENQMSLHIILSLLNCFLLPYTSPPPLLSNPPLLFTPHPPTLGIGNSCTSEVKKTLMNFVSDITFRHDNNIPSSIPHLRSVSVPIHFPLPSLHMPCPCSCLVPDWQNIDGLLRNFDEAVTLIPNASSSESRVLSGSVVAVILENKTLTFTSIQICLREELSG